MFAEWFKFFLFSFSEAKQFPAIWFYWCRAFVQLGSLSTEQLTSYLRYNKNFKSINVFTRHLKCKLRLKAFTFVTSYCISLQLRKPSFQFVLQFCILLCYKTNKSTVVLGRKKRFHLLRRQNKWRSDLFNGQFSNMMSC